MRPLRPLSSFEVHERLRRTKRRRAGYSLPFLLSRGVLPFPVEARNGEPLHGPFTITIINNGDRQKERRADARPREVGKKRTPLSSPLPPPSPTLLEGNASNAGKRRGTGVSRPALPPPPVRRPSSAPSVVLPPLFFIFLDQFPR